MFNFFKKIKHFAQLIFWASITFVWMLNLLMIEQSVAGHNATSNTDYFRKIISSAGNGTRLFHKDRVTSELVNWLRQGGFTSQFPLNITE